MNKGILIDPKTGTFKEVEVGDYKDIQKKIDVDIFDIVKLDSDHILYIDDEGLFKVPHGEPVNFMNIENCSPLFGKGLILGICLASGESTDVKMNIEDCRRLIKIKTRIF